MRKMTLKTWEWACRSMTIAFFFSSLAIAQEFSADMISREADGKVTKGKFYRAANKERFDSTVERAGRTFGTYMIVDLREKLIYVVEPEKKRILVNHVLQMTGGASGRGSSSANSCEELIRVIDPTVAARAFRCLQVGSESVNGRSTTKWQVEIGPSHKGPTAFLWVDSQLKVAIKWTLPAGSWGELQNIKAGPQPASLFELPADYGKQHLGSGMR